MKVKVLFYGIGVTTERLEERLNTNCDIIGYTDSRSAITTYKGKKFYGLEEISGLEYDYIIISSDKNRTALEIAVILEKRYGIAKDKILPYYVYANRELYSILLNRPGTDGYECMVFGNSHARDGILTKYLQVNAINFSTSSQDIYGNYRVFQKVIREYKHKFAKLRYVIIDLYDYNVLNYDTSLSKEIFNYIDGNGIMEKHNFDNNRNFTGGGYFEEQVANLLGIVQDFQKSEILDTIFKINEGQLDNAITSIYENRNFITKNEPLLEEKILGSLVENRFECTVEENKALLDGFVREIKTFNPEIKIIFTLIPRYITMERVGRLFMTGWRNELYGFLAALNRKYSTFFFDMKENKSISGNNYFYKDVCHLNTAGGICLTSILNEYISQIE